MTQKARLDPRGTEKPLTRIVHHPKVGDCIGPATVLHNPEYENEHGERTPLVSSSPSPQRQFLYTAHLYALIRWDPQHKLPPVIDTVNTASSQCLTLPGNICAAFLLEASGESYDKALDKLYQCLVFAPHLEWVFPLLNFSIKREKIIENKMVSLGLNPYK